ncbi:MAG: hypothetical protein AAF108_00445 [Planctomycetota bacterium]
MLAWATRAVVLGLSVSLFLHVFGSIVLGSIIVGQRGVAQGRADEGVGTTVSVSPVETLAESAPATAAARSGGLPQAVASLIDDAPPIDLSALVSLENSSTSLSDAADLGFGDLAGGLDGGGGASGTSFFGLQARGSRFAYVVDTSGSMLDDRIERLRVELVQSIDALDSNADFYVVRYSNEASALGQMRKWVDATPQGKSWAGRNVRQLRASGGTQPITGFRLIQGLAPKPDAVFFMTDGSFPPSMATDILRIQQTLDAPVHCITFGAEDSTGLMRRIASESGGQYRHVAGGS